MENRFRPYGIGWADRNVCPTLALCTGSAVYLIKPGTRHVRMLIRHTGIYNGIRSTWACTTAQIGNPRKSHPWLETQVLGARMNKVGQTFLSARATR